MSHPKCYQVSKEEIWKIIENASRTVVGTGTIESQLNTVYDITHGCG